MFTVKIDDEIGGRQIVVWQADRVKTMAHADLPYELRFLFTSHFAGAAQTFERLHAKVMGSEQVD